MENFRHRTDIEAMHEIKYIIVNQINLISGKYGKYGFTVEDLNEVYLNLMDTIDNLFTVFIGISEELHDYKDKELENTLKEVKKKENEIIDLSKL